MQKTINTDFINRITKYSGEETIITDPPFNINYHYDSYGDNMGPEEYLDFIAKRIGKFKNIVLISYPEIIFDIAFKLNRSPSKCVQWVYNANTPRQHRTIAWFGDKPDFTLAGQPYKNQKDKRVKKLIEQGRQAKLYDWWEVQQVKNVSKEKTEHPCQMPLEVMDRIIKITNPTFVIDPFNGSGTTMLACKNNNVDGIGFDTSQKYCQIARARLNKV